MKFVMPKLGLNQFRWVRTLAPAAVGFDWQCRAAANTELCAERLTGGTPIENS